MPGKVNRYFAMIGDEQKGPFEIHQLAEEGVRPDTYVWCKTMSDWTPASQVPEIRRFFQSRIESQQNIKAVREQEQAVREEHEQEELIRKFPPMAQNMIRKSGIKLKPEDVPNFKGDGPNPILPIILFILFFILIIAGFLIK